MTTPKQPATEAGLMDDPESKAARALVGPREWSRVIDEIERPLKEQLATANAGLLALRDWAERSGHSDGCNYYMQFHENSGYVCDCGYDDLMKSTAPAAAEIEARIRAEGLRMLHYVWNAEISIAAVLRAQAARGEAMTVRDVFNYGLPDDPLVTDVDLLLMPSDAAALREQPATEATK